MASTEPSARGVEQLSSESELNIVLGRVVHLRVGRALTFKWIKWRLQFGTIKQIPVYVTGALGSRPIFRRIDSHERLDCMEDDTAVSQIIRVQSSSPTMPQHFEEGQVYFFSPPPPNHPESPLFALFAPYRSNC